MPPNVPWVTGGNHKFSAKGEGHHVEKPASQGLHYGSVGRVSTSCAQNLGSAPEPAKLGMGAHTQLQSQHTGGRGSRLEAQGHPWLPGV